MYLAANPALRESLGRNGRQHVFQHFSRRQTATAYLHILEDLLGKDQRRAAAA